MDGIPPSDAELVAAVRDGDTAAACRLYQRHRPAVLAAVAERLRDPQLVDDAVQEAFTRALEQLSRLRRPERFRPWLLAIARNTATDRWRLERRQMDLDPEVLTTVRDDTPGPEDAVGHRVLLDLVGTGLARLSERDAAALALVTHLDLAPREVGAVLGVSAAAAKVAVHRARRRLGTILALDLLRGADGLVCADAPGERIPDHDAARHVTDCRSCLGAARRHLVGRAA